MLHKCLLALFTLAIGLYASPSSAQIFRLSFTATNVPGGNDATNPLVVALNSEIQKIEDDINKGLPSASTPDRLMKGMANSSVMSGKGVGSDYASNMSVFLIGAGVGVGADLEKNKEADSPISGAGIQGGIIIGTNLGWMDTKTVLGLDTDKLNIYFNGMRYNYEMNNKDTSGSANLSSFGFHASYDWIKSKGSKLLGWGGVKIHTGFEYNQTNLKVKSSIKKDLTYTDGTGTYTSNIVGSPMAEIDVSTRSIPLEISSSVQILYILSLYGGLGADYNLGKATGKGDLNSTPSVLCRNAAGCTAGSGDDVGTIATDANINSSGKVNPFLYRGFAGVQINLPWTRIFVQADKAFGNDLVGATAGLRFAF
jgi:hypothetical protein